MPGKVGAILYVGQPSVQCLGVGDVLFGKVSPSLQTNPFLYGSRAESKIPTSTKAPPKKTKKKQNMLCLQTNRFSKTQMLKSTSSAARLNVAGFWGAVNGTSPGKSAFFEN